MSLTTIDTYSVQKNGKYYKTVKKDEKTKINKDQIVFAKELLLEFDPSDTESVEVAKIYLNGGLSLIVKKTEI